MGEKSLNLLGYDSAWQQMSKRSFFKMLWALALDDLTTFVGFAFSNQKFLSCTAERSRGKTLIIQRKTNWFQFDPNFSLILPAIFNDCLNKKRWDFFLNFICNVDQFSPLHVTKFRCLRVQNQINNSDSKPSEFVHRFWSNSKSNKKIVSPIAIWI